MRMSLSRYDARRRSTLPQIALLPASFWTLYAHTRRAAAAQVVERRRRRACGSEAGCSTRREAAA